MVSTLDCDPTGILDDDDDDTSGDDGDAVADDADTSGRDDIADDDDTTSSDDTITMDPEVADLGEAAIRKWAGDSLVTWLNIDDSADIAIDEGLDAGSRFTATWRRSFTPMSSRGRSRSTSRLKRLTLS